MFYGAFATGVACQQGTLTLPDTWFRHPFWDLLMLKLLRPNSMKLPCLNSTFHLDYPLVLSRFCLPMHLIHIMVINLYRKCGGIIFTLTIDFGWFLAFWEHQNFRPVILWNCNFVGFITPFPFFRLFWHFWDTTLKLLKLLCLANDHWRGFEYPKFAYGPYCWLNPS